MCKSSNSQVKSKSTWLCIKSSQVLGGGTPYIIRYRGCQVQVQHISEFSRQVKVKSIFDKNRTWTCTSLWIMDITIVLVFRGRPLFTLFNRLMIWGPEEIKKKNSEALLQEKINLKSMERIPHKKKERKKEKRYKL